MSEVLGQPPQKKINKKKIKNKHKIFNKKYNWNIQSYWFRFKYIVVFFFLNSAAVRALAHMMHFLKLPIFKLIPHVRSEQCQSTIHLLFPSFFILWEC